MSHATQIGRLGFYLTAPHPCSYLEEREAKALFADPEEAQDNRVYTLLSRAGFRRSGEHIYRPRCEGCQECRPVRIPIAHFAPSRAQRRTWRQNQDLQCTPRETGFVPEHFALYQRYQSSRHHGGGMDDPRPENYLSFLTATWSQTVFHEFRLADRLVAVAVVDELGDALSAVYTFFDPDLGGRSLGRFAVLQLIHLAEQRGCQWLYLGYWIRGSRKMSYKGEYRPLECYQDGHWQPVVE